MEVGGERVRLDGIVDLDGIGDGCAGDGESKGCERERERREREREEDGVLELAPVHLDSKDKVHSPGSGRFEVL